MLKAVCSASAIWPRCLFGGTSFAFTICTLGSCPKAMDCYSASPTVLVLPILGRNAACVATVSELSREHLGHYGIAAANKTVVTYNGSDHALRWNARKSSLSLGARPFVLYIGRSQRYKNGELIWRIAPHLDDLGLDVYVVGALDSESIASFGPKIPGNVRLLGRISDDDLAKLFTHALCFLFPSRIEGFGLPVVEAMVHGCPVVASNAPCLPEVCGDAALFVDPDDDQGWVRQVRRLKLEADLRTALIARGRTRAGGFTWARIAEQYLCLMQEIDSPCGQRAALSGAWTKPTNAETPELAVFNR